MSSYISLYLCSLFIMLYFSFIFKKIDIINIHLIDINIYYVINLNLFK